jgi:hypothetical protein
MLTCTETCNKRLFSVKIMNAEIIYNYGKSKQWGDHLGHIRQFGTYLLDILECCFSIQS